MKRSLPGSNRKLSTPYVRKYKKKSCPPKGRQDSNCVSGPEARLGLFHPVDYSPATHLVSASMVPDFSPVLELT